MSIISGFCDIPRCNENDHTYTHMALLHYLKIMVMANFEIYSAFLYSISVGNNSVSFSDTLSWKNERCNFPNYLRQFKSKILKDGQTE